MFNFIKRMITGGSVEKIVDGAIKGVDALWNTPEEKAEYAKEMSKVQIERIRTLGLGSTQSAITRRFLAFGMFILFCISYLSIFVFTVLEKMSICDTTGMPEMLIKLTDTYSIAEITGGIFAFYFLRQAFSDFTKRKESK